MPSLPEMRQARPLEGTVSGRKQTRTYVYIDGFNLYYGCFRPPAPPHWSRYKWLDLEKLCDSVTPPKNRVVAIKYYTADVKNRAPDNGQRRRQQTYLRALSTLDRVSIVKGRFLGPKVRWMPACDATGTPLGYSMPVLRTEEKGSDVNLAVDLVYDASEGQYECAVIISNDSDLLRAIRRVRDAYQKTIGIINPQRRQVSLDLSNQAHFFGRIRENALAASQLPDEVRLGSRVIRRPREWA